MSEDRFLSLSEVAAELGYNADYFRRLIKSGHGPKALRVGRGAIKFRRHDVDQWIEQHSKEAA
jgi:excisionase family DNA binding protein